MNLQRRRLLVVDDHPVFRMGVVKLMHTVPEMEVVGEAASIEQAVALTEELHPDVVLMDVRLRTGSGIDACREIHSRRPQTRILMLTSFSDEEAVVASLLAGASGYVLKDAEPETLIEAIETISHGGSLLDPIVTDKLIGWMRREAPHAGHDSVAGLSLQERNILPLIAEGKTNREIAAALALSEHTVKTYISNVLQKLQLSRRTELAAFVARQSHS